ncbi:uncharacterized protein FTOL_01464 [Fusarium torulosum]|uniref:Uncharacterized protein n=1 Tax=Fusarium torulosum TaxID=33205 RepID=A0AAE8M003_9HYPO|nr:uncharacterized protein FTOL_01464 [Fusarium torulosum]
MVSFKSVLLLAGLAMAAPTSPAEGVKTLDKRFNGGWCTLHIHLHMGDNESGQHEMNVRVFDGTEMVVWEKNSIWGDGILVAQSENLPQVLNINAFPSGDDVVKFTYGSDAFGSGGVGTTNNHCSVGTFEKPSYFSSVYKLEMDCGFSC